MMARQPPAPYEPVGRIRPPPVKGGTVRRISVARAKAIRSALAEGDRKAARALSRGRRR
jgi:hypothetical protein